MSLQHYFRTFKWSRALQWKLQSKHQFPTPCLLHIVKWLLKLGLCVRFLRCIKVKLQTIKTLLLISIAMALYLKWLNESVGLANKKIAKSKPTAYFTMKWNALNDFDLFIRSTWNSVSIFRFQCICTMKYGVSFCFVSLPNPAPTASLNKIDPFQLWICFFFF